MFSSGYMNNGMRDKEKHNSFFKIWNVLKFLLWNRAFIVPKFFIVTCRSRHFAYAWLSKTGCYGADFIMKKWFQRTLSSKEHVFGIAYNYAEGENRITPMPGIRLKLRGSEMQVRDILNPNHPPLAACSTQFFHSFPTAVYHFYLILSPLCRNSDERLTEPEDIIWKSLPSPASNEDEPSDCHRINKTYWLLSSSKWEALLWHREVD